MEQQLLVVLAAQCAWNVEIFAHEDDAQDIDGVEARKGKETIANDDHKESLCGRIVEQLIEKDADEAA